MAGADRIEGCLFGTGPIEAFVNGLNDKFDQTPRVLDYYENSIGAGADACAVAYLELRIDERETQFGVGIDTNIVSASLKAILSGLQRSRPRASGENGTQDNVCQVAACT